MDIGNIVLNLGNDGVGVCNALTSVRNDQVCVNRKFGLEEVSWQRSCGSGGTHVEYMKDPLEVRPPGGNRLFVVLRVEMSGNYVPFSPLDDVPMNLSRGPAIESSISASSRMSTAGQLTWSTAQLPPTPTDRVHPFVSRASPDQGLCRHQRRPARGRHSPPG